MATDELVFMTGPGPRPLCPYCEAEMGFTTHNMPQCPDAGCISNNPKGMELVNGLMDGIHEMGKQIRELQEENERLTEAHRYCDYAINNNYRAWQEAQAEIVALKASRDRLRRYHRAVFAVMDGRIGQELGEVSMRELDELERLADEAENALEDGDLADADPAPDAGQEVG